MQKIRESGAFSEIFSRDGSARILISGEWAESSSRKTVAIASPASGKEIGRVQQTSRGEIDSAFAAASSAQEAWAARPVFERSEILQRAADILIENKDLMARCLVAEIAKPRGQAEDEIARTADMIRYTAEEGKRLQGEAIYGDSLPGFGRNKISFVERVPLGVVLAIAPFNYPVNLAAAKIAPALVSGNTVVFKPPTQGAICGLMLAEAFRKAGVPAGVLCAVTGRGADLGDYLVTHPRASMIAFTGGTKTGLHIAAIARKAPLLLELGGKDAAIVFPDAEMESTAKIIVSGAFSYSGQRCTTVKRVLLMDSPSSGEIVKRIAELASALKVGLPEDNSDITALINVDAADYVWNMIGEAVKMGATPLTPLKREGPLIWPAVLDRVPLESSVAWEEPFGPVLPIIRVRDEKEALEIANRSEYGLQASVFTRDVDTAFRVSRKLDVGTVQVNGKPSRGPDHFPFVGTKSSGIGTQGIKYSVEAMTRLKATVINLGSPGDPR